LCPHQKESKEAGKGIGEKMSIKMKRKVKVLEKTWKIMSENKLKTLFLSGVLIDFWGNWYAYAIMHDWLVLQAFLGFFLPILNFPFIHWFIDETDIRERFKMTLVCAFSMMIGSTLMLIMIRAGFGVGHDFIP
jgi:hypothetical protein